MNKDVSSWINSHAFAAEVGSTSSPGFYTSCQRKAWRITDTNFLDYGATDADWNLGTICLDCNPLVTYTHHTNTKLMDNTYQQGLGNDWVDDSSTCNDFNFSDKTSEAKEVKIKAGQHVLIEWEGASTADRRAGRAWLCANGGGYIVEFDHMAIANHTDVKLLSKYQDMALTNSMSQSTLALCYYAQTSNFRFFKSCYDNTYIDAYFKSILEGCSGVFENTYWVF